MNCEHCQENLSAWLDNELAEDERCGVEQHLASCATCRQIRDELRHLDARLRSLTVPEEAPSRAWTAIESMTDRPVDSNRARGWRRALPWIVAALAASILFALIRPDPPESEPMPVARLVRITGSLEAFDPDTQQWREVNPERLASFAAGTRLRTRPGAVCELETANQTTLRLDASAEVVLHAPSHVQVVAGKIWSRVGTQHSLRVDAPPPSNTQAPSDQSLLTLNCPGDSEFQWAVNQQESVFQSLTDSECQLRLQTFVCPVGGKEKVSIKSNLEVEREAANVQAAKLWQIPLLAIDQSDVELGGVLESLLVQIGSTKAGFMHEQQVRKLGPAGAIPLLAYVRSERSRNNPSARQHAMRIASETADETARDRLETLQQDSDPSIADYATQAIKRIQLDDVSD